MLPILILLGVVVARSAGAEDSSVCTRNHTIMESTGSAMLSVFVDSSYGSACNISSPKSVQEVATSLYVAQTLNKQALVPGVSLGLRIYDTCNDKVTVYKQSLLAAIENDCASTYDLGILAPQPYIKLLEPLGTLGIIPVAGYADPPELQATLLELLVHFLAGKFEAVHLLLSSSRQIHDRFLELSRQSGVCVRSDKDLAGGANETEVVVVAIGDYDEVSSWLEDPDQELANLEAGKTWVVMTLDNSFVDDLLPEGSYVVQPEQFAVEPRENLEQLSFSQATASAILRSPYLLGVGRAIVSIGRALADLRTKSCPYSQDRCVPPRFDSRVRPNLTSTALFEELKVPVKAHTTRYLVGQRLEGQLREVAGYLVEAAEPPRLTPEAALPRLPNLCLKKLAKNCAECLNFREREPSDGDDAGSDTAEDELGYFKDCLWVPVFLTIAACATVACVLVLVFIVHRFFVEKVLDGNPLITIALICATILLLQSLIPYCLEDRSVGPEPLNALKILMSTLSFGLTFSVMLSRALFLAFSVGGPYTTHINGYLQGLMLFYMAGVELAISSMYFGLVDEGSAATQRSMGYLLLLGYDIFLLVMLFVTCTFIGQIQRNYKEGVCFFGTSIGLLVVWAIWLTCFTLSDPEDTDFIVSFGILGTALLIIAGILAPRVYLMMVQAGGFSGGEFRARDYIDGRGDPRIGRQPQYEYARPELGIGGILESAAGFEPDYSQQRQPMSGSSSANYFGYPRPTDLRGLNRHRSPEEPRRTPGYDNYGFRPEMRELADSGATSAAAYVIPRVQLAEPKDAGGRSSGDTSALSTTKPASRGRPATSSPRAPSRLRRSAKSRRAPEPTTTGTPRESRAAGPVAADSGPRGLRSRGALRSSVSAARSRVSDRLRCFIGASSDRPSQARTQSAPSRGPSSPGMRRSTTEIERVAVVATETLQRCDTLSIELNLDEPEEAPLARVTRL